MDRTKTTTPAAADSARFAVSWAFVLAAAFLASLPALAANTLVSRVAALYTVAANGNAYFVPRHAALLYVETPLAVLGSFTLFLLPGVLTVLLLRANSRVEELLLFGFPVSLLFSILTSTTTKLLLGVPVNSPAFFALWVALAVALALVVFVRARREVLPPPLSHPGDKRRLLQIALVLWFAVAALVPKIFWENFNVDGVEAFEFGRSLTWHYLPRWAVQDGVFGFYQNFILFAFPNHWFTTLLGPLEAAARLPFFLFVGLLYAALVLLIERGSTRTLRPSEEAVVWLGLILYIVVQTYNTNYDPFFADLSEMGATDTLWVLCFLGAIYALWSERRGWFLLFAVMSYLASPGALLLLGLLAGMTFLTPTPARSGQVKALVVALAICALIAVLYEAVYVPRVFGHMKADQFSSVSLAKRIFPPTLNEFVRFNALLFTSGLLPAFALGPALRRRRTDPERFVIAGVTVLFFAALYIQPWTSLHQFTPVMVLPLIVFWRAYLKAQPRTQRLLAGGVALTTLLCLVLSLPRHFRVNVTARELGRATELRIGDAGLGYPRATQAGWAATVLVPQGYRLDYPNQSFGTDAYTWLYYALRPERGETNFIVQDANLPAPAGFTRLEARQGIALYVRDRNAWEQLKQTPFPRVVVSRLYEPILRQSVQLFRDYTEAHRAQPPK